MSIFDYKVLFFAIALCSVTLAAPRAVISLSSNTKKRYVYAEYSMGYGAYAMNNLNTFYIRQYSPVFSGSLSGGMIMDVEVGVCLVEQVKIGLSYVQASGNITSNDSLTFTDRDSRLPVTWNEWYLDSYYRGVGFNVRYYPILTRFVRGFAGGRHTIGRGRTHLGMGRRPDDTYGDYGYDNFSGKGIGIAAIAGVEVFVASRLLFGITGGYRLLRTEVMQNVIDASLWQRP